MGEEVDSNEGIHVVIVGAGLAGLSAALSTKLANPAHRVTVLETVRELQEVGVSGSVFLFPSSTFLLRGTYLSPFQIALTGLPSPTPFQNLYLPPYLPHRPVSR
jgi:salicylate hydroxylase